MLKALVRLYQLSGSRSLVYMTFILFYISPLLCLGIELLNALAEPAMVFASLVGAYGYFFLHFYGSSKEGLGEVKHLCDLLWRYAGFGAVFDEDEAIL